MKSFKVRDGKVSVDGVLYSQSPSNDVNIVGKSGGRIHSINIGGTQYFPLSGVFNDGTTPIVENSVSEPIVKGKKAKLGKTELVERSSAAVDENGKLIKVKRTKKK